MAWPLISARSAFVLLAVFTLLTSFSLLFRFDLDLATLASRAHTCHCSSSSPLGSGDRDETGMPWAYNLHPMVFQRLPEFDRLPSNPNSSADPAMTMSSPLEDKPPAQVKEFLRVTGDERWYGVSMLHQLHCLHMLQSNLFHKDMHSHHQKSGRSILEERGDGPTAMDESHWTHCLSYIAQVSGSRLTSLLRALYVAWLACLDTTYGNLRFSCMRSSVVLLMITTLSRPSCVQLTIHLNLLRFIRQI